jgi:2'-5' RNA ligase
MTNEMRKTLTDKMQTLVGGEDPESLKLSSVGSFNPYNLHFKVEPSAWLVKLHRSINKLAGGNEERMFLPHITISKKNSPILDTDLIGWEFYPESLDLFKRRQPSSDPLLWESYWSYYF